MAKRRCGILGATGSVGQRALLLLADHPQLDLVALGASARSVGKPYKDIVTWKQTAPIPPKSAEIVIRECKADNFVDLDLVFSALDSNVAGQIELEFLHAGIPVFSNSKNHRRNPLVPLVVPTVNVSHLAMIPHQRLAFKQHKGFLVCNSNCAVVGVVVPVAALQAKFGRISDVEVFTEQAISGAGYPGISSMDMLDNVIPYIPNEEDKLEPETHKILGSCVNHDGFLSFQEQDTLHLDATCTRVGVSDGHMVYVSLRFQERPPPSVEQVKAALQDYTSEVQHLGCASAPQRAIVVFDEADRPQPRLDRDLEGGFAVSVGRIRAGREDGHFDLRFVALSHNTIVGAAGSSILNAEAAILKGFL